VSLLDAKVGGVQTNGSDGSDKEGVWKGLTHGASVCNWVEVSHVEGIGSVTGVDTCGAKDEQAGRGNVTCVATGICNVEGAVAGTCDVKDVSTGKGDVADGTCVVTGVEAGTGEAGVEAGTGCDAGVETGTDCEVALMFKAAR
jgi:hypothetical protein